jgi:hypothetical protein
MVSFSNEFYFDVMFMYGPTTPRHISATVWAVPFSLATTCGITIVFYSSGYLDVSVLRVSFPKDSKSSTWRVAPFGNLRIEACMQLPAAYRSLPRPSSTPIAKASTMRPYSLPIL